MKKSFITVIFICFAFSWMPAQEVVEKSTSFQGNKTLVFDVPFADQIIIKSWDKKEVLTRATYNINDNKDNSKFRLDLTETTDKITFTGIIEDMESLERKNTTHQSGIVFHREDHCVQIEIDYEIFLPADVSVSLETISGNVEMYGCKGPAKIKTISGFIDVSFDTKTKANLQLSTICGEMYPDLDLKIENPLSEMRVIARSDVDAMLNGGGADFHLETISGDIYLRKTK